MKISARNQIEGTVVSVKKGLVNGHVANEGADGVPGIRGPDSIPGPLPVTYMTVVKTAITIAVRPARPMAPLMSRGTVALAVFLTAWASCPL